MPVYRFRCRKCGSITEVEHGFNEPHPTTCEVNSCGGELERLFSIPSVVYRGSGFYHTDKGLYEPDDDDE